MKTQSFENTEDFCQIVERRNDVGLGQKIAELALDLSLFTMEFSERERTPRKLNGDRETVVEHSFMVALAGAETAHRYFPELNPFLVFLLFCVHDLPEYITGDIATYIMSPEELAQKAENDKAAVPLVCDRLGEGFIASVLKMYEEQEIPEARFVGCYEKCAPATTDILVGSRVMHEDYDTYTLDQVKSNNSALYDRMAQRFPDDELSPIREARRILGKMFEEVFEPKPIQEEMFSIKDFQPAIAA